jgi:hypothetical protein
MTVAEKSATERTAELFQEKMAAHTESPQMRVILQCIADLYKGEEISSAIAIQLLKDLDVDYQAFHSPEVQPEGSESWKAQRSVQLLFAKTVKTDEAFRCRALRYLRDNVEWLGTLGAASCIFG